MEGVTDKSKSQLLRGCGGAIEGRALWETLRACSCHSCEVTLEKEKDVYGTGLREAQDRAQRGEQGVARTKPPINTN